MKTFVGVPGCNRVIRIAGLVAVLGLATAGSASAQVRVDQGRHTRLQRFGHDIAYGTVEGLGFALVDQLRDKPDEWPRTWNGYGHRAASQVGEFLVQESVTEGLAAYLKRPLDYTRCGCSSTMERVGHAIELSVVDETIHQSYRFATPRVTGAYAGALAQSYWRPGGVSNRAKFVLLNGTASLAIGAGINLWHEFVR